MLDREKCLTHVTDKELRQAMIRLLDQWERAYVRNSWEITGFLDPYFRQAGEGMLRGLPDLLFSAWGGYDGAERARLIIFPPACPETSLDFQLAFLQVEGNFKFKEVNHRDFLGALLGLGIGREKIGDILIIENGCQVILDQDIARYVTANWEKVNCVSVRVKEISPHQLTVPVQERKEITSTVASPRLDAVLGVGFSCSRTKTLPDIKGGRIRVNWKVTTDPSFHIQAGDTISYRGKGRMVVDSFSGPTQKGRYFIHVSRYV
ncbi:RNA-binding protein [Candidatus Formimonas warabiya]|uniref:RNA-binding S4 domain-containing protein n=1 Tax=Formimonas warabiya TaxID=1761012 RepID=A0A3G1KR78_FORW1|nr:YlmH/Sll1252 family protein [Candidatus Formimonas warabiya]ATW24946.1 hypothetical protein DCMF_09320 [Candidatus Formimonas warabiya]